MFGALFLVFLLRIAGGFELQYDIPEPLIEVFDPKGLRASIEDEKGIEKVEFTINAPGSKSIFKTVTQTDGEFWVLWDPDVAVRLHDRINYKITILSRGLERMREGVHIVKEVKPVADCHKPIQKRQRVFTRRTEDPLSHISLFGSGGTKSSMYSSSSRSSSSSNLHPITKSSSSSSTSTFYVKPSGVVEASGFKKESTYDSTKEDGEKWKHFEGELTAEELEKMSHLSDLSSFGLSGRMLLPERSGRYEHSYMSSTNSQNFPGGYHHSASYSELPGTSHHYVKTHKSHSSHSSSTTTHDKPTPVFQFHESTSGDGYSTSDQVESFKTLPNPLPPQGAIVKTSEYIREEHTGPVNNGQVIYHHEAPQKYVQISKSEEFSNQEVVKPAYTPQKVVQITKTEAVKSHNHDIKPVFSNVITSGSVDNQELVKPVVRGYVSSYEEKSHRKITPGYTTYNPDDNRKEMEYNAGTLKTVNRGDIGVKHYTGNIFKSVTISKVKTPQECSLIPGLDYTPKDSIRDVEKFALELSCLATLAESSMKEEIALLKQKNSELNRKYESLEHEVRRLAEICN